MAAAVTEPAARHSSGAAVRLPGVAVAPSPGVGDASGPGQDVASSRRARVATLVAAGLAAASAPLHAWMLAAHSHGVVLTVLMSAMALWCLWCAVGAVRRVGPRGPGTACPRTRALRHLWVMAGAMALLHVVLLTGAVGGAGRHGDHGAHGASAGLATDAVSAVGPSVGTGTSLMLTVVVLELAVCFACAVALRTRHRVVNSRPSQHAQRGNSSQQGDGRFLEDTPGH